MLKKIKSCHRHLSIYALIPVVLSFLLYLPTLQNDFVNWDDNLYIYENNQIRSLSFTFLKWAFTSEILGNWHPLTMVSYALDFKLWGLNPAGYHLTNVLLHSLNTFLVYYLFQQLLRYLNCAGSTTLALLTALFFAIHPLHVESVAWASERKDVLCAAFFLLSLIVYISYAKNKGAKNYIACLIFFILALLSKPMAVSLPLILLVLDYYPLNRLSRSTLLEKTPFLFFSIISAALTVWAQSEGGALMPTESVSIKMRLVVASYAYIAYLQKMIFPMNLAPLYPYPTQVTAFYVFFSLTTTLLFMVTTWAIWVKKGKLYVSIILYYTITLIPVIGIVQVGGQSAADRYTYLPGIGPLFLMALAVTSLLKSSKEKGKIILISTVTLVSILMLSKTISQVSIWKNSMTLWSHELKIFPDAPYVVFNGRGDAHAELGNHREAINDFNKVIKLKPSYDKAYNNRGNAYMALGELQKAVKDLTKALTLNPQNDVAYLNRGKAYNLLSRNIDAISDYSSALKLNGSNIEAYYNRGTTYGMIGNYQLAIKDFTKVIELDPQNSAAIANRGYSFFSMGDNERALNDYRQALKIDPNSPRTHYNLGVLYKKLGNSNLAKHHIEESKRLSK